MHWDGPRPSDGSNLGALPPPASMRAVLSAIPTAARNETFPGVFGADLLTCPIWYAQKNRLTSVGCKFPPLLPVRTCPRSRKAASQLVLSPAIRITSDLLSEIC